MWFIFVFLFNFHAVMVPGKASRFGGFDTLVKFITPVGARGFNVSVSFENLRDLVATAKFSSTFSTSRNLRRDFLLFSRLAKRENTPLTVGIKPNPAYRQLNIVIKFYRKKQKNDNKRLSLVKYFCANVTQVTQYFVCVRIHIGE